MRLKEIKHTWKPYSVGHDNSGANVDIPLVEDMHPHGHSQQVRRIVSTSDDEFGPPMSLGEAIRCLRS